MARLGLGPHLGLGLLALALAAARASAAPAALARISRCRCCSSRARAAFSSADGPQQLPTAAHRQERGQRCWGRLAAGRGANCPSIQLRRVANQLFR